jgi:hypothetical protein
MLALENPGAASWSDLLKQVGEVEVGAVGDRAVMAFVAVARPRTHPNADRVNSVAVCMMCDAEFLWDVMKCAGGMRCYWAFGIE